MRIYISGPITGIDDYMNRFAQTENELVKHFKRCEVVNPAALNSSMPQGSKWGDYMMIALQAMRTCDAILLMDDWETSRGARVEREMAIGMGMTLIEERALPELHGWLQAIRGK